jgi:hypothetical protein
MHSSLFITVALAVAAEAHVAPRADEMYCKVGNITGGNDSNTDTAVNPPLQENPRRLVVPALPRLFSRNRTPRRASRVTR